MLIEPNTNCPRIEFEDSFVEETVFLAARYKDEADGALTQNFHNDREKIYGSTSSPLGQSLTEEDRNVSFQRLYREYFQKLGIKDMFERIVKDFPLLNQPGISLFVKKVWSKREEDTELYVDGHLKTICIALMANRILQPFCIQAILRHELLRISDMLDPHFQYVPHINLEGKNELENNLIRDRFRILWDVYIDIRLRKKGYSVMKSDEDQKKEFCKAFFFLKSSEQEYVYSKLEGCEDLMQIDLLGWAQDARSIKTLGEGGLRCPLCDFTSYESIKNWPSEMRVVIDEIKKDHPQWTTESGICPQCFDLYNCRTKVKV